MYYSVSDTGILRKKEIQVLLYYQILFPVSQLLFFFCKHVILLDDFSS